MLKFFLAVMVSAVLLLIVAADLLVNGTVLQPRTAQMANIAPTSVHLVR